jgi:hypothetical protein
MFGALLGGGLNILGSVLGGNAENEGALSGAQQNAYIQDLNTNFQTDLFNQQQALSQPYLDFGYTGVSGLGQGRDYDFRATPEYQYRQGLGNQALANMQGISPDVAAFAQRQYGMDLDTQEQDNAYQRLLDRVSIGQGQAGQAGGQAQQYGQSLANAYQNVGNMNLAAQQAYNTGQQNVMNTALGQASSIPAYLRWQNYQSGLGQQQNPGTQNFGNWMGV